MSREPASRSTAAGPARLARDARWFPCVRALLLCAAGAAMAQAPAPRLMVQSGGKADVLAVTADGSLMASVGARQLQIWSTRDGRLLCELPTTDVSGLSFSRDGRRLVGSARTGEAPTGGAYSPAKVALVMWNVAECMTLPDNASARFAPQTLIRPLDRDRVLVVQADKLSIAQPFANGGALHHLSVARSGEQIAAVAANGEALVQVNRRGNLEVLDLASGVAEPLSAMRGGDPADTARPGLPIAAISRSAHVVVAPSGDRAKLIAYDRRSRAVLASAPTFAAATPSGSRAFGANWLEISADEQRLYVLTSRQSTLLRGASEATLQIRSLPDLKLLRELPLPNSDTVAAFQFINLAAMAGDGSRLVFANRGADMNAWGTVDLRQPEPAIDRWLIQTNRTINVAWDASGTLVLTGVGEGAGLPTGGARQMPSSPLVARPGGQGYAMRWDLASGSPSISMLPAAAEGMVNARPNMSMMALSADGRRVAYSELRYGAAGFGLTTRVVELPGMTTVWEESAAAVPAPLLPMVALNRDGSLLAHRDASSELLKLIDLKSGQKLGELRGAKENPIHGLRFAADGAGVLYEDVAGATIRLGVRGPDAFKPIKQPGEPWRGTVPDLPAHLRQNVFGNVWGRDTSGRWLATAGATSMSPVEVHDLSGKSVRYELPDASRGVVAGLVFSPDAKLLAVVAQDGSATLWDLARKAWVVRLFSFGDGTWVVVDPDGRFDTNRLENMRHLHWVMPDEPQRSWPLEIFMRSYYEPRLVARLLGGEVLPPVKRVDRINRLQPQIRISEVKPAANGTVSVSVEASAVRDHLGNTSGLRDIRLFRNGALVARAPASTPSTATTTVQRIQFDGIRLPSSTGRLEFSAYAFNSDGVKSETHRLPFDRPSGSTSRLGRAYVLSIGIDAYENAAWNLQFAANDARTLSRALSESIAATRRYDKVVALQLISVKGGEPRATRAQIKAVLDRLAGLPATPELLAGIAGAVDLDTATPDDLVLISFSGHGYRDGSTRFHLFPSDIGSGVGRQVTPELLARTVSSDHLAEWIGGIDAGSLSLIIDACHSGAAVQAESFKPGPMGSRGLGQLAYDKGIRVLAASQADDVAIESGALRRGLLTFALADDGIRAKRADYAPVDKNIDLSEWLNYSVGRVPTLYRDLADGKPPSTDRGATLRVDAGAPSLRSSARIAAQQPVLFDFRESWERRVIVDLER